MSVDNRNDQPFRLLDLPKELRLMIYERIPVITRHHVLQDPLYNHGILLADNHPTVKLVTKTSPIALLCTCRFISEEAKQFVVPSTHGPLRLIADARCMATILNCANSLFYYMACCSRFPERPAEVHDPDLPDQVFDIPFSGRDYIHKAIDAVAKDPEKFPVGKSMILLRDFEFWDGPGTGAIDRRNPRWAAVSHFVHICGYWIAMSERHTNLASSRRDNMRIAITVPSTSSDPDIDQFIRDLREIPCVVKYGAMFSRVDIAIREGVVTKDQEHSGRLFGYFWQWTGTTEEPGILKLVTKEEWKAEWCENTTA